MKKIFFIIFLIQSLLFSVVFAQTKIKKIWTVREYDILSSVRDFTFLDFDSDTKEDIIFFGANKKKVHLFRDFNSSENFKSFSKFFFYPISDIQKYKAIPGSGQTYIFTSRKKRKIGLLSFTKSGTLQLLFERNLIGYPEKIFVKRSRNNDNILSIVYGEAFDGFSLVEEEKYKLAVKKMYEGNSYSQFYYLSKDEKEYSQLIGLNIITNSFDFFDGDDFIRTRSLKNNRKVLQFKLIDFNKDSNKDILYSTKSELRIIWGDSISSFSKDSILIKEPNINDFTVGDIDSDGNNDIIYVTDSELKIRYNLGSEFSVPFILSLCSESSKVRYRAKKIILSTNSGKVKIFNLKKFNDATNIVLTSALNNIWLSKDKQILIVSDKSKNDLKFYFNIKKGMMAFLQIPLFEIPKYFQVDALNNKLNIISLNSTNGFEFIKINNNSKISGKLISLNGKIENMFFKKNSVKIFYRKDSLQIINSYKIDSQQINLLNSDTLTGNDTFLGFGAKGEKVFSSLFENQEKIIIGGNEISDPSLNRIKKVKLLNKKKNTELILEAERGLYLVSENGINRISCDARFNKSNFKVFQNDEATLVYSNHELFELKNNKFVYIGLLDQLKKVDNILILNKTKNKFELLIKANTSLIKRVLKYENK